MKRFMKACLFIMALTSVSLYATSCGDDETEEINRNENLNGNYNQEEEEEEEEEGEVGTIKCITCKGSGICDFCHGDGVLSSGKDCNYCDGSGLCHHCDGEGYIYY